MRDRLTTPKLIAFGFFAVWACATPAEACPPGSQFFAYGGAGGCVADGKMVMKCFHMGKVCPSGWSNEGESEGKSWCCPPPPRPKGTNCVWRGTAPFCGGECEVGETLKGRSGPKTMGCATGSKAFCCR
jgi:hypothetical protein